MNHTTELALANARANIYRFFAALWLAPPSEALLARMRTAEFRAACADGVTEAQWNEMDTESLEALVREYHRLFVVPGEAYVPPYESVYTDVIEVEYSPHRISGAGDMPTRVGGLLWGPSTMAVARAYAAAGFTVTRAGEPPDHLGIELQFLARLCEEQASAWSADDAPEAVRLQKIEQEFLIAHPLRFVAAWRARVEMMSTRLFYRVWAQWCESFLQSVAQLLDPSE